MDATHFHTFFRLLMESLEDTCLDTDSSWFSLGRVLVGFKYLIKLNWRPTVASLALQIAGSPQKWCPSSINILRGYFRNVIHGLCWGSPGYVSAYKDLVRILGVAAFGSNGYLCCDDYSRPILAVVLDHSVPLRPGVKLGLLKVLLEQGADPNATVCAFALDKFLRPVNHARDPLDKIHYTYFSVKDFAISRGCLSEWLELEANIDDTNYYPRPKPWAERQMLYGNGMEELVYSSNSMDAKKISPAAERTSIMSFLRYRLSFLFLRLSILFFVIFFVILCVIVNAILDVFPCVILYVLPCVILYVFPYVIKL